MVKCTDCKYHRLDYVCGNDMQGHYRDACHNVNCCAISAITGEMIDIRSCHENRLENGNCGVNGFHFEASTWCKIWEKFISMIGIKNEPN